MIRSFILLLFVLFFLQSSLYDKAPKAIEQYSGNLPVILSVPHGGTYLPRRTIKRDCPGCITKADSKTIELAKKMRSDLYTLTKKRPHVVINNIHRSRLDMNRDLYTAIDDNYKLSKYWHYYHEVVEEKAEEIIEEYGFVLILDLHGHRGDKLLLGYDIPKRDIENSILHSHNSFLNSKLEKYNQDSLLVGYSSLGSICQRNSIDTYPSDVNRKIGRYFDGGYNTERYLELEDVVAIQLECGRDQRFEYPDEFSENFTESLVEYLRFLYNTCN